MLSLLILFLWNINFHHHDSARVCVGLTIPLSLLCLWFSSSSPSSPVPHYFISSHRDLSQSFVNSSQSPKVHLIGTIEYDDVFPERFAHVFRRLCLAGPGWARGRPAHVHAHGLAKGYVASVVGNARKRWPRGKDNHTVSGNTCGEADAIVIS